MGMTIKRAMETFRLIKYTYLQPLIVLLKISVLSGVLILFVVYPTMAKGLGTLTGFVIDDELNEPLEKAVVTISGTLISVLTDQQGKFTMKLVGGDYMLEVNYPGYFTKRYNMSVIEDISTPMFIIKLKANAVGRTMQRSVTSYENSRQFPQSIENFSTWQIAEQNGHQEFNELLRNIPSTAFLSNGSGYNDSEIGFRGNDPTKTSYTFDGIMLNNPETGQVGASMLSGLTDWAGQIQVTTGQAANLQSQLSSGGLVNVLSFAPHEKAGAEVMAIYGNQGFLKTSATVHSGLSKNGLTSSIQISRTSGNGLAQNIAFKQYGFFVDIHQKFNQFHTLVLNLNGIIQQHDRNGSDSIGAYNLYGTKYNRQWGTLNDKPLSWSTNNGRSPFISLTHIWQPRIKTHVKTQIYAQFNRSAQLKPGGLFNNQTLDGLPRDSTGLVSFGKITDWNKGMNVSEMGAVRQPDSTGKFINSENSGINTLASIDRENRFGLRSVLTHNFTKELDVSGSFDLEDYHASHFGSVHDLLGADGYTSFSEINRPDGFTVSNLFQSKFFPSFNSADKTAYFYESGIQSGGFSVRANYQSERLFWYFEGSGSVQNISRTDHFNYLSTNPERQSKSMLLPGGRAQTGFTIHFWRYHSIHLKTSYGSYQPLFAVLFPSGNNWKNNAPNEQVFDAEFGYTIFSRKLKIEALAYRSQVANRSMVRWFNLNPGDSYGLVNGLAELHQGVELKTAYKITKNIQIKLNGSLGDWKYTKDATAQLYDAKNQNTGANDLWIKDVRIANAPQFVLFGEAEWRWAHNFYVRLNYYRADRIYAPFGLYDFGNLANRTDFKQWKLPAFELLGASGNYLLKLHKLPTLNLIFGAQNLLDTEYIEQSATNIPEGNPHYTSNQVYYGIGRTWFAGIKIQF
jgi:hypothetical protein